MSPPNYAAATYAVGESSPFKVSSMSKSCTLNAQVSANQIMMRFSPPPVHLRAEGGQSLSIPLLSSGLDERTGRVLPPKLVY